MPSSESTAFFYSGLWQLMTRLTIFAALEKQMPRPRASAASANRANQMIARSCDMINGIARSERMVGECPMLTLAVMALVKSTPSPKTYHSNCKQMLRQQHAQTPMSGKSAQRTLRWVMMNVRFGFRSKLLSYDECWHSPMFA